MLSSYLAVARRNLWAHKAYSLISVVGLALGLACCLLLTVYIGEQLAVDDHHSKADRIYRVLRRDLSGTGGSYDTGIDGGLAAAARAELPDIEQTTRLLAWDMWVKIGDKNLSQRLCLADVALFDMFDLELASGDPATALAPPGSMVITQAAARRYLGDADPVGATVSVDNDKMGGTYTIAGVVRDIPAHARVHFDVMTAAPPAGAPPYFAVQAWEGWRDSWHPFQSWMQLRPGADPVATESRLGSLVEPHKGAEHAQTTEYRLQQMRRMHLYGKQDFGLGWGADIEYLKILSLIGAFVLVLACINFTNLATARSIHRAREIGLRKVVGAHRRQLAAQLLGEAVLVSLLSLVVSFALAWVALPLFNPIVDESYIASDLLQPGPAAIMALVAVGAGLLAGSYPALALSGFQPVSILKTSTHAGGGAWLRRALVLFQFAATIVLLVCTLVVYQQTEYMRSRDLGLEQEHLVVMPIGFADLSLPERYETVKARFAEHPKVVAVTAPWGVPAMWSQDFTVEPEGAAEALRIDVQGIDNDFLETFGMKLVAGRNVDVHREGASEMLLNETAVRALGWEDPIGKSISWQQGEGQVVGVVADYHAGSMHNPIRPILLCDWLHLTIVVRIAPDDVPATMAFLEDTWHSFVPERPFEARFLDEVYDGMYWSEESQGRSFATLSGLAIFVACLGLLGLSAFSAGQRTREIGIRRVLGASQPGVVLLLSRESVGTVLLATVAAWPTAWWATRSWLQDYPYAVELSPVLFLMAGLVVLLLALVTFASQALRVASSDPVEALRYE